MFVLYSIATRNRISFIASLHFYFFSKKHAMQLLSNLLILFQITTFCQLHLCAEKDAKMQFLPLLHECRGEVDKLSKNENSQNINEKHD